VSKRRTGIKRPLCTRVDPQSCWRNRFQRVTQIQTSLPARALCGCRRHKRRTPQARCLRRSRRSPAPGQNQGIDDAPARCERGECTVLVAANPIYRLARVCGIIIPHRRSTRRSLNFMPKRGTDADGRIFFDELVSLTASRLKATGAIRLEDRHGIIAFGEKQKLVGVAHTVFENGGSWSYFICPRCGGRKKKLWLVDDAPRCLSCCWSLGVRYRSAYGFGRSERLRERDRYIDRVQHRRLRGRKRRLTMTMRRSMITCRLAQLAHQQKARNGSDEPLPFMRAYHPRKAAIEAIPDLQRLWKAQTTEALEQALDQVQIAILDALRSDDIRKQMVAASLMLKTRAARQLGWT
jgi:hypothetical protein